ncbi:MAG: hypothetical protein JW888_01310 [Pirellulales bacterium]|nr:hypothetical protein [Pirellulales bacterium]
MIEDDQPTSFEARLASLRPRSPRLQRDHLMFLAGQASVVYWPRYRTNVARPVILSVVATMAVTFLVLTATESGSRIVDQVASAATTPRVSHDRPVSPSQEDVQYRFEVGNSLGWVFSFLVGKQPDESDTAKPERNLVQLREALLKEDAQARPFKPPQDKHDAAAETESSTPGP